MREDMHGVLSGRTSVVVNRRRRNGSFTNARGTTAKAYELGPTSSSPLKFRLLTGNPDPPRFLSLAEWETSCRWGRIAIGLRKQGSIS